MTPFDQAFALLKMPLDEDMIQKFTNPYGTPKIPFTDFIDYYPELLTENLEDLIPHLPEGGDDTRVHLTMPPHHQPVEHLSDEEQAEIYGHRSGASQTFKFPEPIRPSGWWYSGYGDSELRTLARNVGGETEIIDPPPIADLENVYFQTGLQQQGVESLWNRAHYQNQLKPTTWERRMDGDKRHREIPISEAKFPKEMGEEIIYEGKKFKNTQDLIAHLLSTPGQEEWSEKKRSESDAPFGGVAEGHDTRGGRKAARRTKRMQDRNE